MKTNILKLINGEYLPVTVETPDEEIVDRRTRSQKINDLIREKYSQDAVEAIFANYLKYLQGGEEKEEKWLTEYEEFQNYREVCKQKVDAEGGEENG